MKNKLTKIAVAAGFMLAFAFTFSCSSGDDIGDGLSSSSSDDDNFEYGSLPYQGKTYKTIKINHQTWMAENLNYNVEGSKCYENSEANCDKYGRLYNWIAATSLCPSGWHLPSNADWDKLFRYVDGISGTESPYNSEMAGKYLKSKSGWRKNESSVGENKYGFSAMPGGYGTSNGSFSNIVITGRWWSANEYDSEWAYSIFMNYNYDSADYEYDEKFLLLSVRCVKD